MNALGLRVRQPPGRMTRRHVSFVLRFIFILNIIPEIIIMYIEPADLAWVSDIKMGSQIDAAM